MAYQTAWLKYYYPVEFMAAQLTSEAHDQDKTVANLNEAKRLGIKILPPDVNRSEIGYTMERTKVLMDSEDENSAQWVDGIRMGMLSIKGVGGGVITEMTDARTRVGEFKTFDDFYNAVSARVVNRSYMEKLILAGVFDSIEPNRYILLNHFFFNIRKAIPYQGTVEEYLEAKSSKDKSLKPKDKEYPLYDPKTFDLDTKLRYEKESIGMFVSGHPLEELPYKPWTSIMDNEPVSLGGMIKSVKKHKTKGGGKEMAFVKLETQGEDIDCTIFPKDYEKYKDRLYKGNIVIMKGKKQIQQGGREGLLVDDVNLSRKKKFRVDNDDPDAEVTSIPSEAKARRQQQIIDDYALSPAKEDPLAALFE